MRGDERPQQGLVAAARGGTGQRRAIEDPQRQSRDRLLRFRQSLGGNLRGAFDGFLIADDDCRDPAIGAAEGFQSVAGRSGERGDVRLARQRVEPQRPDRHFALDRLLPALIACPAQEQ